MVLLFECLILRKQHSCYSAAKWGLGRSSFRCPMGPVLSLPWNREGVEEDVRSGSTGRQPTNSGSCSGGDHRVCLEQSQGEGREEARAPLLKARVGAGMAYQACRGVMALDLIPVTFTSEKNGDCMEARGAQEAGGTEILRGSSNPLGLLN